MLGGGIAAWCFLLTALLLWRGLDRPIDLPTVLPYIAATVFFGIGCLFAYWTYGCLTMRYGIDRNGLTIRWGDIRQFIPMDAIERLVPGREEPPPPRVTGVSWVGHHVGHGHVGPLGEALFYSTHRSHEDLLYVVTPEQTYGISVEDEVRFAEELQAHQKLGTAAALPQATERSFLAAQPFWQDGIAQLMALAAALGCAALVSYVFYSYPGLPDSIPFSFPSLGVTRVDGKGELLSIPTTGVGLLLLNLGLGFFFHAWERAVGYLLFLTALGAQGILIAATAITLNQ